jgi:hypothetical protein
MEMCDAKRLRELERENAELKKMLAESLLKNRVLEEVNSKNGERSAQKKSSGPGGGSRALLGAPRLPLSQAPPLQLPL